MSMLQTQNDNLEKAILFETKEEALLDMTLSEHVTRLNVFFPTCRI